MPEMFVDPERDCLRAENERLRVVLADKERLAHRLAAECVERMEDQERLRAALDLARLVDPTYGNDYGAQCACCGSIEEGHAESCPFVKFNNALSLLAAGKAN